MRGLGTTINIITVVVGSLIGMFLKGGLPKRFEKTVMSAVGSAVILIGLTGALPEMLVITDGKLTTRYVMLMVLSLVIGCFIC